MWLSVIRAVIEGVVAVVCVLVDSIEFVVWLSVVLAPIAVQQIKSANVFCL